MIIACGRFWLCSKVFNFWETCRSVSSSTRYLQAPKNNPGTFHHPAGAQRLRRPARKSAIPPCGFMMFRMGGAEAFARQHASASGNRQNDTRPIQPSQPPMASQIHPESHRPIADSPEWHGGGRPCDQCGEATEQFQVIVLVKQIAKITDGLVHVLVSAPIVPGTIAALVMRAQVAVEHQSVEDAVQPLDGDAPRPVVRVRIQTGETFGDRQSDGRGLDLEEPYRLAERKIVGQHPQRDLAVVVFHAMADIRLAAIVAPVARVTVQLKYP